MASVSLTIKSSLMKATISIIILVVLLIISADIKINFKPFKVTCESPLYMIGLLFLAIGFSCITYSIQKQGIERGFKQGVDFTVKTVENYLKTNSKKQ
jgi:prepilin signal peptidase PulO-like enzyme (type II secretory pathway)